MRAPRQNPTPQSLLSSRPQLGHPQLRQFTTSTGAPVPSDLHWPQHTLQGHKPLLQALPPSQEPGGQASLLSALGSACLTPGLPDSALGLPFPHSQPEGSALKCRSDPSQLLAVPAPALPPGLLGPHPHGSSDSKLRCSGQLQPVPCSRHSPPTRHTDTGLHLLGGPPPNPAACMPRALGLPVCPSSSS